MKNPKAMETYHKIVPCDSSYSDEFMVIKNGEDSRWSAKVLPDNKSINNSSNNSTSR